MLFCRYSMIMLYCNLQEPLSSFLILFVTFVLVFNLLMFLKLQSLTDLSLEVNIDCLTYHGVLEATL